eukprot:scpid110399/ scgid9448/ 
MSILMWPGVVSVPLLFAVFGVFGVFGVFSSGYVITVLRVSLFSDLVIECRKLILANRWSLCFIRRFGSMCVQHVLGSRNSCLLRQWTLRMGYSVFGHFGGGSDLLISHRFRSCI